MQLSHMMVMMMQPLMMMRENGVSVLAAVDVAAFPVVLVVDLRRD